MNQQIQFKAGQVQVFVATRSFALGQSGVTVPRGAEVEFDGTSVSYAGMQPVVMPQLRGALRTGWLVPAQNFDPCAPEARPQPAGMTMRPAEGGNPMDPKPSREVNVEVDAEAHEVASVVDHASATRERNRDNYRRRTSNDESAAGQRYSGVVVEHQDGVPVPGISFKTPSGKKAKSSSADILKAGELIHSASKVKIQPGVGRSRDQLIADARAKGVPEEEILRYEQELAARRATKLVDADLRHQVVGQVRSPQVVSAEGFKLTQSVGGGTEIADLGGTGGQTRTDVVEEDGIKFTTTNGPKKVVRFAKKSAASSTLGAGSADDAVCRTIARSVCSDFPDNYVFTDPTRKKIARLQADYDDRPDVIRAVAAAETDGEIKRRLVEEFPEVFNR